VASLEGDLANVALETFRLAATYGQRPSVGQAVTVAVRPEKIRLSRQPLKGPNAFEGRVEEMTYIGKDSDYRVRIGRDVRLRVRVQNQTASSEGPAPGEAVWVQWPPSSARLLQE